MRRGLLISGSAGLVFSVATPTEAQPSQAQPSQAQQSRSRRAASSPAAALPVAARVALQRARQLEKQGVASLAAVQFRAAVAAAPQSVEAARALAAFYSGQERWDEASEAWRQVLFLQRGAPDRAATAQLARAQSALLRHSDALPAAAGQSRVSVNESTLLEADDFALADKALADKAPTNKALTSTRGSAQTSPRLAQNPTSAQNPTTGILDAPTPPDLGAPDGLTAPVPPLPAPPTAAPTSAPPTSTLPAPASSGSRTAPTTSRPPALAPTRRAVQAPVVAATAATNISALPFRPPAQETLRVSRVNAAKAWPLVNRAATELAAGRTQNALRLYQSAYKIDPTNAYAAPGIGTSFIVLGRFAEAATAYRNYLAIKPGDLKALRGLADALTFGGKYREALGVNNAILARQPRNFAAAYQGAQVATYLRSYALSDRYFNTALTAKPDSADAWAAWGESLSYRRDPRAVSRFNRALNLTPNLARALAGLGDYYSYTGQFGNAIPRYRAALSARPGDLKTTVSLADALTYSGQTLAAVPLYRAALQKQPANRAARLGLGRALVYSGSSETGAAELRRVLAAEPANLGALEALALAQADFAPSAAIGTYNRVLARQTSSAARAKTLASIGDLRARGNEFPLAIESYAQASALAPSDPKINLSYAQLLASQEEFGAARPIVESLVARYPGNAQALALQ
ncbi:MAG TPA: tetratricopeptide repeat protein, partial [Abditibacterium sp.]